VSRYVVTLHGAADKTRASNIINAAPYGARVEVKAAKRTLPQNKRMWAMLTDIAMQVDWDGGKRRPDDWRIRFLDGLKGERTMLSNLDGTGVIEIGRSSSDLSKEEMSDMIELMYRYGAEHGVQFNERSAA
jgi:hypothetical protein